MSLGDAALAYARDKGWLIFPLEDGGKLPRFGGYFEAATCDLDQIRKWWTQWPNANIGRALLPDASGFPVVGDFDLHGEGEDGFQDYELLKDAGLSELPHTARQETATGGGQHLFFYSKTQVKFFKLGGFELRAGRHYVVLPPSRIQNGVGVKRYHWISDPWTTLVAELPNDWARMTWARQSVALSGLRVKTREDLAEVLNAFCRIDFKQVVDYSDWIDLGYALKGETGDESYDLFDIKSQEWGFKHRKPLRYVWDHLNPEGSISAGTIFEFAKRHPLQSPNTRALEVARGILAGSDLPSAANQAAELGTSLVAEIATEATVTRDLRAEAYLFLSTRKWFDRASWTAEIVARLDALGLGTDMAQWLNAECLETRNALLTASVIRVSDKDQYVCKAVPWTRMEPRKPIELDVIFGGSPRDLTAKGGVKPITFHKFLSEHRHVILSASSQRTLIGCWEIIQDGYLNTWIFEELPVWHRMRQLIDWQWDEEITRPFIDQLKIVCGDDWKTALKALAYAMQGYWTGRQSQRLAYAMIFASSEQGIGKTNVQSLLSLIAGPRYSVEVSPNEVSRFDTSLAAHAMLVKLNEVKFGARARAEGYGIEEKIKDLLPGQQDDERKVEAKFVQAYMAKTVGPQVIATTNHISRLYVGGPDLRRLNTFSPSGPLTLEQKASARRMFDMLSGKDRLEFAAHVGAMLVDVAPEPGTFDAAFAPKTTVSDTAWREGATGLRGQIVDMLDGPPFVSPEGPVFGSAILRKLGGKVTAHTVASTMSDLGFESFKYQIREGEKVVWRTIYARRSALRTVEIVRRKISEGRVGLFLTGNHLKDLHDVTEQAASEALGLISSISSE